MYLLPVCFYRLNRFSLTAEDIENTEEDKEVLKCTSLKRSVSYPLCEYLSLCAARSDSMYSVVPIFLFTKRSE